MFVHINPNRIIKKPTIRVISVGIYVTVINLDLNLGELSSDKSVLKSYFSDLKSPSLLE